jgi:hypothetical protein
LGISIEEAGVTRERLLRRIDREWNGFLASFEGLPERDILEPGVVGEWSVRDLMAHVTTWEEEALANLPLILEGRRTPRYARYGGIDAFNALTTEKKSGLTLDRVGDDLEATHRRLLEYLSGVPETALASGTRFYRRLRLDTFNHYREHGGQIEAWRRKRRPAR